MNNRVPTTLKWNFYVMLWWLFGKRRTSHEHGLGEVIETSQFREISTIQARLWARKKVPKSLQGADQYWKDLSNLCALLMQLNDLPASTKERTTLLMSGKKVPPFCDDDRWYYYRWCRGKMAQQLHREKKFKTALRLWFEIAIIDDQKLAFEKTVYLGGIAACAKRGKIPKTIAESIFFETASSFLKCNVEETWRKISNNLTFYIDPKTVKKIE